MNRYLEVALETAQQAGALLLREFGHPSSVEYKTEADLVASADRRVEAYIVERLGTFFPQHALVAEEGSRRESETGYCWYVDPLDGTTNFAHGFPVFSVSLALVEGEEFLVGVVHDPTRGETFHALRGQGAWLNQRRLQVSVTERLGESLLGTGFPTRKRHQSPNIRYYERFTNLSHGVRRAGSAALDLCSVAAGRFDGFWEFNLHPWDVAAGALLVREAGGMVTDLKGISFRLGASSILASNGRIHEQMRGVFLELAEPAPRMP